MGARGWPDKMFSDFPEFSVADPHQDDDEIDRRKREKIIAPRLIPGIDNRFNKSAVEN